MSGTENKMGICGMQVNKVNEDKQIGFSVLHCVIVTVTAADHHLPFRGEKCAGLFVL